MTGTLFRQDFLDQYKDFPSNMTKLGKFVYYRTYSRYLPQAGRRETWKETVARAVHYNCNLVETTQEEMEMLFDNIFNLRASLSGRTLYVGGTEVASEFPISNFNCAFQVIDDFEAYRDLFYLLMVGSGVGVRVRKADVEKLPRIKTDIKLIHREYMQTPKGLREDNTSVVFEKNKLLIMVGDSKEGWAQAIDTYFRVLWDKMYVGIDRVEIDYGDVRPKGERLKRFGGTASGHTSLQTMFEKIHRVVTNAKDNRLSTIDTLDIANIIGENVVSGGVRRTSEIGLFDKEDTEILEAKQLLFTQNDNQEWVENEDIAHRKMSNNSVIYWEKPTMEELEKHMALIRYSGEPGFINGEQALARFEDFEGVNPCAEILLPSKGLCNLVSANAMAFVVGGKFDLAGMKNVMRLNARSSTRMTYVDLELPKWDRVQKENRLIGCSITGWQDMKEATGMTVEEEIHALKELKAVVKQEADTYADELGIVRPKLTTTVKPEGTQSLLPTVSPGVHKSHAPFYIRRVRITAQDPLCKVAEELGWIVKAENGQEWETASTKVIEFPVKSPTKRSTESQTAIEQLETYKRFMDNYVEHNCSITVSVKEDEWEEVTKWTYENWDSVVAVSFLPSNGGFYPLLPLEEITENEYILRELEMEDFNEELLPLFELGLDFDLGESDCETGLCPVR